MYILGILGKHFGLSEVFSILLMMIAYFLVGYNVLFSAIRNLVKGSLLDENFLMTIATIGAIAIGEYPEAVGVMLFYGIGEYLESKALAKSRKNIEALMNIKPEIANLIVGNEIVEVDPNTVKIGDKLVVKVGEKVPLDGKIIKGESLFDTSAITGESVYRSSKVGDQILSGVINQKSVITMEVLKTMKDSTVSKILDMVENATSKKSKTENFITVFAKYYTPIVVILALALSFIPPVLLGEPVGKWLYRGLIFLVVSCPCALVLSIPLSYFSGIGVCSRNGILVKGSNYLEALKYVDTVVMDKTGTITKGIFEVSDVVLSSEVSNAEDILRYACISEARSTHPIALSILEYCKNKCISNIDVEDGKIEKYEEIPSNGIKMLYDGVEILAGNKRMMENFNIQYIERNNASTKVHIAVNKTYYGCIEISDELKEGMKDTISNMKEIGIKEIVMLTGDSEPVAKEISKLVGIDTYYSNLLPNDKVDILERIMSKKNRNTKVAFIGDGINDAPVIARADVGISMGGMGSDAAIEASDVVFMTDEISKLPLSVRIARHTGKIVWQNIVFALSVKIVVLALSALGLTNMWVAIFSDVGVALLAVLNSLRVLKYK